MAYHFVKSPYFQSRRGKKIDGVVIHTTVGFYEGTIKYFQKNDRSVSAHFVVSLNGSITQMVDEAVGANHAGIVSNPTTPVYKGFNPNWNTIGIENADNNNPAGANRENQYPNLGKLVADICKRHNIPIDRDHICGHRELYNKKTCPGNLDVDKIIDIARITSGTIIPTPPMDTITRRQLIIDAYMALTGDGPSEAEITFRLDSWQNPKALIESLTGDGRFTTKYITPKIQEYLIAHPCPEVPTIPPQPTEPVFTKKLAQQFYEIAKSFEEQ